MGSSLARPSGVVPLQQQLQSEQQQEQQYRQPAGVCLLTSQQPRDATQHKARDATQHKVADCNGLESGRFWPREEISKHNRLDDLWVVVDGKVYDITEWMPKHPGGTAPLTYAGADATVAFHKIHNKGVLRRHQEYLIGHTTPSPDPDSPAHSGAGPAPAQSVYDAEVDEMGYDVRVAGEVEGKFGAGREFGDHMAREGEISRIPFIICMLYLSLLLWSGLAHAVAGCSWWTVPLFYFAGMVAYYAWHRLAHEAWSGPVHRVHMKHHLLTFPPSDFYGDADTFAQMYPDGQPTIWSLMKIWRSVNTSNAPADQAMHLAPLVAFMLAIVAVGYLVCGCSSLAMLFVVILYALVAIVGSAFHMSFHVRGFHLEKYRWYSELRTVHYIHHLGDMKSDFAMVNLQFDVLFHSLRVRDPASERSGSSMAALHAAVATPLTTE